MKKILFSITFILFSFFLNAQTSEELVVWMKEHKTEIFLPRSFANNIIHGEDVAFTEKTISLTSAHNEETTIPWKKLIYIYDSDYGEDGEIILVSRKKKDGHHIGITLSIADDVSRTKYLEAFKNLAKKNGARFTEKEPEIY